MWKVRYVVCAAGLVAAATGLHAQPGGFAAFGADENECRHVGEAAIGGATGPEAAQRYDYAHWQCMNAHAQARWMQAYRNGPGAPPFPTGNPDNHDFPNAFYSIPYATPGYGYDGFSPY